MSTFRRVVVSGLLALAIVAIGVPAAYAAGPVISGFAPVAAKVAAAVTISGSGFTGASAVTFSGVPASFTVPSDTQIATKVPNGALTGPITVTVAGATAVSGTDFKVVPNVASFAPSSGSPGSVAAIYGSAFTGATAVTFNATPAVFHVVSYSEVDATVPSGATTGKIAVTTPGGIGTSVGIFTVIGTNVSTSPASGPPTKPLTASGSGFQPFERVDVFFDTTLETVVSADGTGAFSGRSFAVPGTAVPGTHWVTGVGVSSGRSAQTPFTVSTDWSQFRFGNRHKGVNPYENVLSTATVGGLDEDWSFPTGTSVSSSPVVSGGIVYLGSTKLYALNAATGALVWVFSPGSGASSPAVANGTVYVGGGDGKVYALNASTGALVWSAPTGGTVYSSPAIANGTVYVGSHDGKVYAFNASTGALVWSYTTGGPVYSSPGVANGIVYVGSYDDKVYALSASTGALIWSYTTGYFVYSSPTVANGVVFIGSQDGTIYALHATTGHLAWSYPTGGEVNSSPAVANGIVYVGSTDGYVYALGATTGGLWWTEPTPGGSNSSPAVANGIVYIGSYIGAVYALDAWSGSAYWTYATDTLVDSSPAVSNGMVYVGAWDNSLYAFGLDSPPTAPARPDPATLRLNP